MINRLKQLLSTTFAKNSFIYFAGRIISGFIIFFSIPLIIRCYGVTSYGEYSLVQNIILINISLNTGWLNQCILRFNSSTKTFNQRIYKLLLTILLPSLVIGFIYLIVNNHTWWNIIFALTTIILGGFVAVTVTFHQSKFNAKISVVINFIRVVSYVLSILVLYIFLGPKYPLDILIFSFFISYFITSLSILYKSRGFFNKNFNIGKLNIERLKSFFHNEETLKFLNYGWPLVFWFISASLINVFSRYAIDYFLDKSAVGVYSSIFDLLNKGIILIFSPLLIAGYPLISKQYNEGQKTKAYKTIKYILILELLIFLFILLIAYLFRDSFIINIVGIPITPEAKAIVFPILIGVFFWQLAMFVHKLLELELKTKLMLIFIVVALIINITLNVAYLPTLGIIISAYATTISAFAYLLMSIFYILLRKK